MSQRTIRICAANVQSIHSPQKRLPLFTRWARTTRADIFLLSEVGHPTLRDCQNWRRECHGIGLDAIFYPDCQAAIVWRPSSPFIQRSEPKYVCETSFRLGLKRSVDAVFSIGGQDYFVMAVYVPVQPPERRNFLARLATTLPDSLAEFPGFIGGDWNVVPNPLADSSRPGAANTGEEELHQFIDACNLQDTYRMLNPNRQLFTNKGTNGTDRRLDQIYISNSISGGVSSFTTWQPFRSTHNPIVLQWIVPGAIPIGPSWFKLGRHISDNLELRPYLEYLVESAYQEACVSMPDSDPISTWQTAKTLFLPRLDALSRKLARLDKRLGVDEVQKLEGLSTRARLPAHLSGHQSIHLRLKQVREQDLLPSLKTSDGQVLTRVEDMLEESRRFFSELYEREPVDTSKRQSLLSNLSARLKPEQVLTCQKPFKKKDLLYALMKSNSRSSPGPDGLPFGFYEATWSVTGPILKKAINYLLQDPLAKPSHMTHIVLLHKKGEKDQLTNKRPISLINTDERVMDRAINMRLAPILPSIIHPSQTGFIPGRWIGTNIETIQNAIDDGEKYPGALAVIDFEKAYDRVDHGYLDAVLSCYGFPRPFINLIQAMTLGSHARVFLNGWLSSNFPLKRGLRQGSPLAPSLFALCIEPLAANLRLRLNGIRHTHLTPFQEDIPHLKTLLFADDLVVGLKNPPDLRRTEECLDLYQNASGGRFGVAKSFLFGLGAVPLHGWTGWPIRCTPFRYLGVQVGRNVQSAEVWTSLVLAVKARMRAIPMFDLSIAARCSIINIYCLTKVLYVDQFMPATDNTVAILEKAAVDAVWGGRRHKVSKELLFTPKEHGGYGLLKLDVHLKCTRAKWVAALLSENWRDQRYLGAIRRRISQGLKEHIEKEKRTVRRVFAWLRHDPNTFQSIYSEFSWVATFAQPTNSFQHPCWEAAKSASRLLLPQRWQSYLDGWNFSVQVLPKFQRQWSHSFIHPALWPFDSKAPIEAFHVLADPTMSVQGVSKARKHILNIIFQLTIPLFDHRLERRGAKWKTWWRVLQKVRSRLPREEDAFHLYALGRLDSPKSWIRPNQPPDARYPNNTARACILCNQDAESWDHVLFQCNAGRDVWQYLCPPTRHPTNAVDLLSIDDPDPLIMGYGACYVSLLHRFVISRRLSRGDLQPLDHALLKREARQLARRANQLEQQQDEQDPS